MNTDTNVSDAVRERAWNIIATVRDDCPRDPRDVDTNLIVDALAEAGLLVPTLDAATANGGAK